jgi:hypothetical protein
VNLIRIVRISIVVMMGWSAGARAQDLPPNFTGTWKLDRSLSESMREMLKAQGYNAIEVSLLERVPVTQVMSQTRDSLAIEIRATIVRTSELLRFDGQSHPDRNNVVGPLVRLSQWSPDGRQLLTTTKYNAKCGLGAEMTVTRTIAPNERNRLLQETKVKLADGREFKARQVFVRLDSKG